MPLSKSFSCSPRDRWRLLSAVLTFLILIFWYLSDSEAEPWSLLPGESESSRFRTLRYIAASFNQGYPFQLEPGIPMENHWEDPGTAFFMVCLGFVKRFLGLGLLDAAVDPYRVEYLIIILPLALLFFTPLFRLPSWYWAIVPLFFLIAIVPFYEASEYGISKSSGLLILSISARWAKVPAAFWVFTVNLQFWQWWKEKTLFILDRPRIARIFVFGILFGLFISIRKDILTASGLAILGNLVLLCLWKDSTTPLDGGLSLRKKWVRTLILLLVLLMGMGAVRTIIQATWKIRDHFQEMKDFPRIYGHPTWHTLYAALGNTIPGKTIRWGDEDAWHDVSNLPENRNIRYASEEHEQASRRLYLQTIAKYPGRFLWDLVRKAGILVKGNWKLITLNLGLFLLLFFRYPDGRVLYLILMINALASTVVPILVIPDIIYSYDFRAHQYLALITGGLWFCQEMRKHSPVRMTPGRR